MKKRIGYLALFIVLGTIISAEVFTGPNEKDLENLAQMISSNLNISAVQYIDSLQTTGIKADTLHFLKGKAFLNLKKYQSASEEFSHLLKNKETVSPLYLRYFRQAVKKIPLTSAIDRITILMDSTQSKKAQRELLLTIGQIYEENHLFSEAIDAYYDILKDSCDCDKQKLYIQIASNFLYQKNYDKALQILNREFSRDDSVYYEQALYLKYLNYQAAGNSEMSKNCLLKLYLDYPQNKNGFEIRYNLAEIFSEEHQYLLSWYLLNEIFQIGTKAQRYFVLSRISDLKTDMINDSLYVEQFKNIKPDWERILNDGEYKNKR